MSEAFKYATTIFQHTHCGVCHIEFYMPSSKYEGCINNGHNFHCHNGHSLIFTDTEAQKLKKRLQWATERGDRILRELESEQKSKAAIKGAMTKIKKRIAHGICPCCKRTFQNLA